MKEDKIKMLETSEIKEFMVKNADNFNPAVSTVFEWFLDELKKRLSTSEFVTFCEEISL